MVYMKRIWLRSSSNPISTRVPVRATSALGVFVVILALFASAAPASANNCLKDVYGKNVQCSANDVSVSYADNPRTLSGTSLTHCTQGSHFDFVADFHVT